MPTRRTVLGAAGAGAVSLLVPQQVKASDNVARPIRGVVELFTSQGCSSCPPADKFLHTLLDRDDVLPLAFHVDYWDYLGWKDTLASPQNTQRQYAYRETLGNRSPYTPQAVINGASHVVGSRGNQVEAGLAAGINDLYVPISVVKDDMHMRITVGAVDGFAKPATLTIAYFQSKTEVVVERGENHGKTLVYANAVRSLDTLGMWSGEALTKDMPLAELSKHNADNCAILVQQTSDSGAPGPILGAAVLMKAKTA